MEVISGELIVVLTRLQYLDTLPYFFVGHLALNLYSVRPVVARKRGYFGRTVYFSCGTLAFAHYHRVPGRRSPSTLWSGTSRRHSGVLKLAGMFRTPMLLDGVQS